MYHNFSIISIQICNFQKNCIHNESSRTKEEVGYYNIQLYMYGVEVEPTVK
jgi:hypothetical protein